MSHIASKNTQPEMVIRRLVHCMGFRYRLHVSTLPGKPDLVFPSRKCVIFVHGCFWHQHQACREGRMPGTRQEYWVPKLSRNVDRDQKHQAELEQAGWRVLVIWECELHDSTLKPRIVSFLAAL